MRVVGWGKARDVVNGLVSLCRTGNLFPLFNTSPDVFTEQLLVRHHTMVDIVILTLQGGRGIMVEVGKESPVACRVAAARTLICGEEHRDESVGAVAR